MEDYVDAGGVADVVVNDADAGGVGEIVVVVVAAGSKCLLEDQPLSWANDDWRPLMLDRQHLLRQQLLRQQQQRPPPPMLSLANLEPVD